MASDPGTLDRAARKAGKSTPKARKATAPKRGPTLASLRTKVERAARQGRGDRPDIGAMKHAERDKILFG